MCIYTSYTWILLFLAASLSSSRPPDPFDDQREFRICVCMCVWNWYGSWWLRNWESIPLAPTYIAMIIQLCVLELCSSIFNSFIYLYLHHTYSPSLTEIGKAKSFWWITWVHAYIISYPIIYHKSYMYLIMYYYYYCCDYEYDCTVQPFPHSNRNRQSQILSTNNVSACIYQITSYMYLIIYYYYYCCDCEYDCTVQPFPHSNRNRQSQILSTNNVSACIYHITSYMYLIIYYYYYCCDCEYDCIVQPFPHSNRNRQSQMLSTNNVSACIYHITSHHISYLYLIIYYYYYYYCDYCDYEYDCFVQPFPHSNRNRQSQMLSTNNVSACI
jgi:hypothetical protein